ncbi:B12-binding domain-containing protein [Methanomethylovorans sp.]|uniref:cobalamin B12-binding domain-containing protein n=1 Tax=Methanomethylovorans sp. TaxID=2758717 RepID=UPI00351CB290
MLNEDKLLVMGYDALVQINEKKVLEVAREWMDNKYDPGKLLNKLTEAMMEIGKKFDEKEYFLAQFILSSNIMENVTKMVLEEIAGTGLVLEHKGTIIMGTVKNDIHDLGKKIAASMLRVEGFTVIDLGKDVPADIIVKTAVEHDADIIIASSMTTLSMTGLREIRELLETVEQRNKAKLIVSGAPVTQEYADLVGADAYAKTAADAVMVTKRLMMK